MANLPGFVGGTNLLDRPRFTVMRLADAERSINVYPRSNRPGTPKTEKTLSRTEGMARTYSVGSDPVTVLFYQDGRAFGVAGTAFLEFFDDDTYLVRGTVADDGIDVATISSNGSAGDQLFITAGSTGYTYTLSTDTLTAIADPDFPANPVMGAFWAGYFFVLDRNSRRIQWSALEDGTDWDPLDVFETSWTSDNISFIAALSTNLYLIGTQNSTVLYLTGDLTVVAPVPGVLMGLGCIARQSAAIINDELYFLTQNKLGGGQLVCLKGYQPDPKTTLATAIQIQRYSGALTAATAINGAIGFAMQLTEHVLYWLLIPNDTQETTLVFDVTEQTWHERAHWDSTACVWVPHRAQCHMYAFERHYVGDRLTGAVYEISAAYLSSELQAA